MISTMVAGVGGGALMMACAVLVGVPIGLGLGCLWLAWFLTRNGGLWR